MTSSEPYEHVEDQDPADWRARVLSSRHGASQHDPPRGGVTMRKPTAIGLVSLLLGLAALLADPPIADAQDEVKLGAFLPISGISADVGAQMKAGTEVALERMPTLQVGG